MSFYTIMLNVRVCNLHNPHHTGHIENRKQHTAAVSLCRFKCCNLHDLFNIFLDNGVMNTPKRRILSLVFIVLCI